MSQTKVSKITIRNKPGCEGNITTGANVQVLLDGQPIKGLSFLKLELKPSKIAKVTMEMYVEVDSETFSNLEVKSKEPTEFTINKKPVDKWVVGNPSPVLETKE